MKKIKKNYIIIGAIVTLLIIIGVVLALVLKPEKKVKEEDKKEETPINLSSPKLQIVDPESKSRPYAVMINNLGVARPYHTGLQDAYLVYEMAVEGGITRYLALFKDKLPEVVGSVRSARPYYLDYVLENDAYYVHWGWSNQAESDISSLKINNINGLTYGNPYFFRQNLPIDTEHTGFANLNKISELVKKIGYRSETNKGLLLNYSISNINLDGEKVTEAKKVDLKTSNGFTTNYLYDSENNVYKQSVNNKAHTDYKTKEQYTVKNIIAYKIPYSTVDNVGHQAIKNTGTGTGYFITGGKSMPITWKKENRSAKTKYYYLDRTEIKVNDGNTWIHLVPNSGSITIS